MAFSLGLLNRIRIGASSKPATLFTGKLSNGGAHPTQPTGMT